MGSAVDQKDIKIAALNTSNNGSNLPSVDSKSAPSRSFPFGCHTPYSAWTSFCNWLHNVLEKLFGTMGEVISTHPFTTIVVAILIVGVCSIGFLWLTPENRTSKIFVPQNSKSVQDLNKANTFFQMKLRQEQIIIVPRRGEDILDIKCLKEALEIHRMVENLTGYVDICSMRSGLMARSKEFCIAINPLELFNFNEENFVNVTGKLTEAFTSPGFMMSNGRPSFLNMPKMFGGISKNKSTNEFVSAQALKLTYFLEEPESGENSDRVEAWEELFIKTLSSLQDDLTSVTLYISAERSLDDAISASSSSDIRWFSLTFTLMLQFSSVMVGKLCRNPLTGHSLLALGGTLAVGLGILAGFSLSMMIQTPFVRIVGVLPFLVIGIGLDDMFIIVDHLDRQERHLNVPVTVRQVMSGTGVTITMTTLTDLVAFAVSTHSQFPSITYFCTYAALTISCAFIMIVTVFVALLSFDVRRIKANRRNCLPMCHAPEPKEGQPPWDEPRPQISNRLMERWGTFLMRPATKAAVLIISLGVVGAGIYATIHLDQEFDRTLLAKEGSYYKAFLEMNRKFFKLPTEVSVVLSGNVKYGTVFVQNEINRLSQVVAENRYFEKSTISWMGQFLKYCRDNNKPCDGENFAGSLKSFLNTFEFSYFKGDIKFGHNGTNIDATRIIAYITSSSSSVFQKDAMLSIRKDLSTKSALPVYAAAASFIFLEQYAVILSETIRNLTVAALAILIVTAPFLINLSVSFLVFFGFVSLIFELFGMMWLLGVSLNSISMINLVMAIGFSVDYSAHIAHAFVKAPDSLAEKRVIKAVTNVGASVLLGGASTLIGIFMTAFSKSEIFQIFFKMFFSMVLLGLLHGLCFLPVHLSILYKLTSILRKGSGAYWCDSHVGVASDTEGVYINPSADAHVVEDLPDTSVTHTGIPNMGVVEDVQEIAVTHSGVPSTGVEEDVQGTAVAHSGIPSTDIVEDVQRIAVAHSGIPRTDVVEDLQETSAEHSGIPSAEVVEDIQGPAMAHSGICSSQKGSGDALNFTPTKQLSCSAIKERDAFELSQRPICKEQDAFEMNQKPICEQDATEEEQSNDVSSSHPDYLTDGNRKDKCNEEEDLSNETKM